MNATLPKNCRFTNLPVHNPTVDYDNQAISYFIKYNNEDINIRYCNDFHKDPKFNDYITIIGGLILNKKYNVFNGKVIVSDDKRIIPENSSTFIKVKDVLKYYDYPKTRIQKMDNLMLNLLDAQEYDGSKIDLSRNQGFEIFWRKNYFKNVDEFYFYFATLKERKLLDGNLIYTKSSWLSNKCDILNLFITFEGLNYAVKLQEQGELSNNCFIAMSFDRTKPDIEDIRNAIKEACEQTGFHPILIDEIDFESSSTINDAIVANIKKSKFCIADFTEQKDGVYFESGFVTGQGNKVFYSCRGDWFKKSHFDTNHFPHIIYSNPEELKKQLIVKIEAWIK